MRRPARGYTDSFRIIGGGLRSRRFGFPPLTGLRPTPDRVRQTLFDWLSPTIVGARCLDLFAGSGALGLEALSRGAAAVTFVDSEPAAVDAIRSHLAKVGAAAPVLLGDALATLAQLVGPFDVVFVDPPYASDLRARALAALAASGKLARDAKVYVEGPADEGEPALPAGWRLHRSKRAGNVGFHLAIVGGLG